MKLDFVPFEKVGGLIFGSVDSLPKVFFGLESSVSPGGDRMAYGEDHEIVVAYYRDGLIATIAVYPDLEVHLNEVPLLGVPFKDFVSSLLKIGIVGRRNDDSWFADDESFSVGIVDEKTGVFCAYAKEYERRGLVFEWEGN